MGKSIKKCFMIIKIKAKKHFKRFKAVFTCFSLTIHSDNCHIATGQVGKSPQINVWNCGTLETEAILKDGHQHGISSLSFSRDGSVWVFKIF